MTRIDRYPLLPGVFASVYPNPKSETAHDTSKSDPAPPPNAKCSAADVAAMVAKLEHAAPGPQYEANLSLLKRCVWLQSKSSDEGWVQLRAELGPKGTDFMSLNRKDPRVDLLTYGKPPNTLSKFGL